jgi:aerobic C4-dicarboxylate transport protein
MLTRLSCRCGIGMICARKSRLSQTRAHPFYHVLWVQVLLAMVAAVALGYLRPERAVAMKPLGDAFIRLIPMIITLIIFCTVVTGIAGMGNLRKVGSVGGMALLYFEVVSTLALLIGLLVDNVARPGSGFNVNVATLDASTPSAEAASGTHCCSTPAAARS